MVVLQVPDLIRVLKNHSFPSKHKLVDISITYVLVGKSDFPFALSLENVLEKRRPCHDSPALDLRARSQHLHSRTDTFTTERSTNDGTQVRLHV